jgi:8-amino-7-oxononanoate synthase
MTADGSRPGLDADARQRLIAQARQRPTPLRAVPTPAPVRATPFDRLPDYDTLTKMRAVGAMMGVANPFYRSHDGHASATSMIDGVEVINFASYDYLGLNADPRPAAAAHAAIDTYGVSPSASRLVAGERPVHGALERALARHYRTDAAVVFVSGHATNVATIGELMGEGDLILHDSLIHNSVMVGAKLSGASRRSFAHNDLGALARLLAENRSQYRNALVVVEGLYSMDGDIAPLPGLIALKKQYGFWLMVDEAHSLGSIGATGQGSFEAFGIDPSDVDIWMGTLSKTLGSTGGYVAGSTALVDLLKAQASGFVYSVGLAPAMAAAALTALDILHAEPDRAATLQSNAQLFLDLAAKAGLDTGTAIASAVIPVMVGDSLLAAKVSERLLARGLNALPIIYPAVPMQSARLRFFITSAHSPAQIEAAVRITKEERDRLLAEGFGCDLSQMMDL